MQDLGKEMNKLIATVLKKSDQVCETCETEMVEWRQLSKDGKARCSPVCMACGAKGIKVSEQEQANKMFEESLETRASNYFKRSSLFQNSSHKKMTFENYVADNDEAVEARMKALLTCEVMTNGSKHLVLAGSAGVGKTHLAVACCWKIVKTDYKKRVLFINYSLLLEQLKFSFSDEATKKSVQGELMKEIKTCDLLCIDDLGAEIGIKENVSSDFSNDIITRIVEAREDKNLIVTTNFEAKKIKQVYGERVLSRILKNSNVIRFQKTKDRRIN